MKKILKSLGLLAGVAAVVVGGKLIYDHYSDDQRDDVVETDEIVEEEVTPVVEDTEDTVEDETTV